MKRGDKRFDEYPEESIADWHERQGLTSGRGGITGARGR